MKRKVLFAVAFGIAISAIYIRYAPVSAGDFREIAHYAVSVREFSRCAEDRNIVDELRANAAYLFVAWNKSGYNSYRASGRQLLNLTVGKLKCATDKRRFQLESDRAIRAIELALDRGEDIDALNGNGNGALHTAIYAGNHHVIEFLLSRGARLDTENSDGKTASEILSAIVEAEIGYDATFVEPLLRARN